MIKDDAGIKAVRDARRRISAAVGHDPRKLVERYRELQQRHRERVLGHRSRCAHASWQVVALVAVLLTSSACVGEDPKVYATIQEREIRNVEFSRDGKTLAIRSGKADLVLWDVPSRTRRSKFENVLHYFNRSMVFLFDGKSMALDDGGKIMRLDMTTGKSTKLYGHETEAQVIASADGKMLASCDFTNIIVWDVVNARKLTSFAAEKDWDITSLGFLLDGRTLAGSGLEGAGAGKAGAWLWDIEGRKKSRFLAGHMGLIAASPDGKSWAAAGNADAILVWDTQTDKLRAMWPVDIGTMTAQKFSPNGKVLIAAGGHFSPVLGRGPGLVAFIDTGTGKLISSVKVLPETVGHMSLSPDGKLLAVSTESPTNEMRVFDVPAITALR